MQKGYMTEALKLFSSFLFASKQIKRLQIKVISNNKPSKKVAEKCGFKFEGVLRSSAYQCGDYYNLDIYSLIREDIENLKEILKK